MVRVPLQFAFPERVFVPFTESVPTPHAALCEHQSDLVGGSEHFLFGMAFQREANGDS